MDMIAERVIAAREDGWQDPDERAGASTARSASPISAARRSTTRRTTSSRRPSRRWAPCRSRTRPAYDTPARSPVWGPRSGAAAPPRFLQDLPERRLHPRSRAPTWPRRTRSGSAGPCRRVSAARRSSTSIRASARTSAIGRPARADPRRHRHRLPRRADPPRAGDRVLLQGVRPRTTPTRRRSSTRSSRTPRTSAASSRASTPRPGTYDPHDAGCYEGGEVAAAAGGREHATQAFDEQDRRRACSTGRIERDETLQHPRCVFQLLKRHFARYTPEMVERRSAASRAEQFHEVAETLIANSGRERTTALCYAVGWTQHIARRADHPRRRDPAAAAGQHRPPRRRRSWRCAATRRSRARRDIPTLYDLLPGYLHMPHAREEELTLEAYLDTGGAGTRLVVELRQVHRLAAEGLVRRRGDRRRTTTGSRTCRRSPATTRTSRRCCARSTAVWTASSSIGQNPAVGSHARRAHAARAAQHEVAGRARPGRDRDRDVLARRARGASTASCAPRTSRPRCS